VGGVGGGGDQRVRVAQGGVVGDGGQFGVEGTSALGDGGAFRLRLVRLAGQGVELAAQGGDPGPARLLTGALAHVRRRLLRPAARQRADAEAPVRRHPGVAAGAEPNGGQQPGHRPLAYRRGPRIAVVDGRAQHVGERRTGERGPGGHR
jgi:hypothetical protein